MHLFDFKILKIIFYYMVEIQQWYQSYPYLTQSNKYKIDT